MWSFIKSKLLFPSATTQPDMRKYVRMTTYRRFILKDETFRNLPVVRMMFRDSVGHDQGLFIGGHVISARVLTEKEADDMIDITIRVNAAQAVNLPFVETYDA